MFKGLIGKKIGMTQIFDEKGRALPVTLIEAGPCFVTQIRQPDVEGYSAVQLGFGEAKAKHVSAGERGHLNKVGAPVLRYLREFRTKQPEVKAGDTLRVDTFALGDHVDIIGVSKGKGFAGAMKRHNFGGASTTHGQSDRQRAVGSIGAGTAPGHVNKGKKMPGHLGVRRVTAMNLKVVLVNPELNVIGVHGAVAGGKGSIVSIREARKA